MRSLLLAVTLLAVLPNLTIAARTVKVLNKCSYTVWPVATPFGSNKEDYTGDRGWQAASGSSKEITVPSSWLGRIWGRHGCVANSDGTLACVTGACAENALNCANDELGGGATAVELRLESQQDGQYDLYNLQNGGGWGVPIAIKALGPGCDYIACTPTLSTCPDDRLKLQDSYGNILGCNSACYGGIGDPNVQCCKGDYNNAESCTPDLIQFYSYFKNPKGCENAYAYFQDARAGQPTVNFICKSEDDPGFTVTFCPDGDGDSAGSLSNASGTGQSGSASNGASKTAGGPTASGPTSIPSDLPAVTSAVSVNMSHVATDLVSSAGSSGSTHVSSVGGSSAGATTATHPASSSASPSSDSTAASADASSSTSGRIIPALSNTMLAVIAGSVAALLVGGAIVAFCVMRKKDRATPQQGQGAAAPVNSDEEAARGGSTGGAAGTGKNPGQAYNALGHGSRRRSRTALLSSSEEETSASDPSDSDVPSSRPRRGSTSSMASRRSGVTLASRGSGR